MLQVGEADSCNRRVLVLDGFIGIRAPLVGGGDPEPLGEGGGLQLVVLELPA